MLAI
jgi:hypothetical protein